MSYNATRVTCKQVTMHKVAQMVLAGRCWTGLTGDYDLHMEFAPEAPRLETTKGPVEFLGDRPDRAAVGELGARWRE
jgi:hypothetical protein